MIHLKVRGKSTKERGSIYKIRFWEEKEGQDSKHK